MAQNNDKLPEEIAAEINAMAILYTSTKEAHFSQRSINAYEAGATAYVTRLHQCDKANSALEEINRGLMEQIKELQHDRAREELKNAKDAAIMFCNKYNVVSTQLAEMADTLEEIKVVHKKYHDLNGDNPAANHLMNIANEGLTGWQQFKDGKEVGKPGLPLLPEPILTDKDVKDWEEEQGWDVCRKAYGTGAAWVKATERVAPEGKQVFATDRSGRKTVGYFRQSNFASNGVIDTFYSMVGSFDIKGRDYESLEWYDESGTTPLTQQRADLIREANNRDLGEAAGREDDAVAFAEWIMSNGYWWTSKEGEWMNSHFNDSHTTAQLYDIFKQQKEK